jgi:rhodanese-related sulfurtransferase
LLTKQEKQKLLQQAQLKHLFNLGNSSNGVIKCNNSSNSNSNVKRSSSLMIVSNKLISKRKCEPFQRISASSLVRYLSINNQINVSSLSTSENQSNNVSSNVSMYITHKCVLFDLRSLDEYDMYHIRTAYNYHCVNIARDRFPTEMLLNKNKPNTNIIIYHTNEKSGIEYATHLYDKGFDNIYYLTGGIENFIKKYPEHIEGEYKEYLITLKCEARRIQRETLLLRQGKRESKYHPCYKHK